MNTFACQNTLKALKEMNSNANGATKAAPPKHAQPLSPERYDIVATPSQVKISSVAIDFAEKVAPITKDSVVHDNGCGTGAVTEALRQRHPDWNILVYATDIAPAMVDCFKSKNWTGLRTEPSLMDMCDNTLPESSITHMFSNASIFAVPELAKGMTQAHRTLKPGGVATVSALSNLAHMDMLKDAVEATRPAGSPVPTIDIPKERYDPSYIAKVFQEAGFAQDNIQTSTFDIPMVIKNVKEWNTIMWGWLGGMVESGWLETDEQNWDEAIAAMVTAMQNHERYHVNEKGEAVFTLSNYVVVGRK